MSVIIRNTCSEVNRKPKKSGRNSGPALTTIIDRPHRSFTELAQQGVGRLLITGAQTDACIRSTLHGAFTRGYDTLLVGDAHTTDDYSEYGAPTADQVIAHTNMYWSHQTAPGREAGVVQTAEVDFDHADHGAR